MESLGGEEEAPSELLRWYILVQEFDFEVYDTRKSGYVGEPINKPVVYHISNPEPS